MFTVGRLRVGRGEGGHASAVGSEGNTVVGSTRWVVSVTLPRIYAGFMCAVAWAGRELRWRSTCKCICK